MHLAQLQNFVLVILTQESASFQDLEPKEEMPPPGDLIIKYNFMEFKIEAATTLWIEFLIHWRNSNFLIIVTET